MWHTQEVVRPGGGVHVRTKGILEVASELTVVFHHRSQGFIAWQ